MLFSRSIEESVFIHQLTTLREFHLDVDEVADAFCAHNKRKLTEPDPNQLKKKVQLLVQGMTDWMSQFSNASLRAAQKRIAELERDLATQRDPPSPTNSPVGL